MPSVFKSGFTTKQYGYGLGLHSFLNFLNENNGSISVSSDGATRGAEFRVEIGNLDVKGESWVVKSEKWRVKRGWNWIIVILLAEYVIINILHGISWILNGVFYDDIKKNLFLPYYYHYIKCYDRMLLLRHI